MNLHGIFKVLNSKYVAEHSEIFYNVTQFSRHLSEKQHMDFIFNSKSLILVAFMNETSPL
jgi:hypothetical protein